MYNLLKLFKIKVYSATYVPVLSALQIKQHSKVGAIIAPVL